MNKFLTLGCPGRFHHVLVRCVFASQTDVLHDGIVKQDHILEYNGKASKQGLRLYPADIRTSQRNLSSVNIPEPGSQLCTGGFSASRRPYQGCHLSLSCCK